MGKQEADYHPRIGDLVADQRPRERLAEVGPQGLSDAELLALLLRVGRFGENVVRMAERVLAEVGGLSGLHRASYTDLCLVAGIGPAKAALVQAAVELGRRIAVSSPQERQAINSPADAANLLMYQLSVCDQEYLYVLLLDTRNRVIGPPVEVYHGSVRRMAA